MSPVFIFIENAACKTCQELSRVKRHKRKKNMIFVKKV